MKQVYTYNHHKKFVESLPQAISFHKNVHASASIHTRFRLNSISQRQKEQTIVNFAQRQKEQTILEKGTPETKTFNMQED
jgi:hypothetical protein